MLHTIYIKVNLTMVS